MYEAHFKRGPWQTHFDKKVVRELIMKYPPAFPRTMLVKHEPQLNDCILMLLGKEPENRLGSDDCETEVLEHDYF